jgi:hypothetical protein
MSWLSDLLGKVVKTDSETLPDRKILRFLGPVTVEDNSSEGSTDVTVGVPSGSYTPVATGVTNVTTVSGNDGHYIEATDTGIGYGSAILVLDPTAAGTCEIEIDSPSGGTIDTAYGSVATFGTVTGGGIVANAGKLFVSAEVSNGDPTFVICTFTYKKA